MLAAASVLYACLLQTSRSPQGILLLSIASFACELSFMEPKAELALAKDRKAYNVCVVAS